MTLRDHITESYDGIILRDNITELYYKIILRDNMTEFIFRDNSKGEDHGIQIWDNIAGKY